MKMRIVKVGKKKLNSFLKLARIIFPETQCNKMVLLLFASSSPCFLLSNHSQMATFSLKFFTFYLVLLCRKCICKNVISLFELGI